MLHDPTAKRLPHPGHAPDGRGAYPPGVSVTSPPPPRGNATASDRAQRVAGQPAAAATFREDAAKLILAGLCANMELALPNDQLAGLAVNYADALILRLAEPRRLQPATDPADLQRDP